MSNSNAIKSKVLGMPYGTANGRLRKSLIWEFVKKLSLDSCFQCKKLIETIEELSIEHKEAWLQADDPIEAFFDVENIAFSHLSCNVGAGTKIKTKCFKGHLFTKDNITLEANGDRRCTKCRHDYHMKAAPAGSKFTTREYRRSRGWKN